MQISRRSFLQTAFAAAALPSIPSFAAPAKSGIAVQLYSIRDYINPSKGGVGLPKALADVKALGYAAVEFAGYWGFSAADLKKMLDDNGLKAAGTHVGRSAFAPNEIRKTIDFNLGFGNTNLICPGGGMWPGKDFKGTRDEWWKQMTEFYAVAAATAGKANCTLGYHNHTNEFKEMTHGTCMWDYFFSNTPNNVCMEQDVGWTTCAGSDPCKWYKKFPHRSPTLHAKENGMGNKDFEGILGQPGSGPDGKPSTKGVDWDKLFPVTDADGVKWYVVECERNASNLKAIKGSIEFLKAKGRC